MNETQLSNLYRLAAKHRASIADLDRQRAAEQRSLELIEKRITDATKPTDKENQ